MAASTHCLGPKKPCPCKTPQVVVVLLGQAAAGVSQALYTAINVLQAAREKEEQRAQPAFCGRGTQCARQEGQCGGHSLGDRDVLLLPSLGCKSRHSWRTKLHPKDSEGFNVI